MVGPVTLSPPTSGEWRDLRVRTGRDVPVLVVTCRSLERRRSTWFALRRALPSAVVARTPFRGVLRVDAGGDPCALAAHVTRACQGSVGRVTAILEEVPSTADSLRAAAARIAARQVAQGESFAFRMHKRGAHEYMQATPELEREVGAAIWVALEQRDSIAPRVDLSHPDVLVNAEVVGPTTFVGVLRRTWLRDAQAGDAMNADVTASTEGG